MRAMTILVAGDPVPEALRSRGDFPALIKAAAAGAWSGPWRTVDLRTGDPRTGDPREAEPLPALSELAGVLITGSAASVTEGAPWMERAAAYLRELVSGNVPVLGICFGHQLLGHALGGRVTLNPEGREIGSVALEVLQRDPLLGDPGSALVNMTHMDSVVELPAGAVCLARTALERCAAVRFAPCAWGVQFHPEIDGDVLKHYVRARRPQLLAEGFAADELVRTACDTPDGVSVMARFLRLAATMSPAAAATAPAQASGL
jgi:GMP synthase (glutamine-hydrolysing)